MKAFDPRKREINVNRRQLKFRAKVLGVIMVMIIFALTGQHLLKEPKQNSDLTPTVTEDYTSARPVEEPLSRNKLRQFTGPEFTELFKRTAYPNTAAIDETTPITGNAGADARIRNLAEERGYILTSAPVTDAFRSLEKTDYVLQERAASSWLELKKSANNENVRLGLTDAYRSADEQRDIFMIRLRSAGIIVNRIASGSYDSRINQLLKVTAPPGYSRHHTGYTVDISCQNQPGRLFENSLCFDWIKKNNYENAKKHGWIPSYPENSPKQGPDPEAWEYVWVGSDALYE